MPVTYYKSPVGMVQITEDNGFVSRIHVMDEHHQVTPAASAVLELAVRQLDEYFKGVRKVFDLPVKQPGSAFQQKVWQQLQQINYGSTISYAQQSKLMNSPLAIRAIAAANGKNNLWVVVPCHRVIGSNGSLTGYAGGLWRKQWLLQHEASVMGIGQVRLNF